MELFILETFNGNDYDTHTIFMATSFEEAKRLCYEFAPILLAAVIEEAKNEHACDGEPWCYGWHKSLYPNNKIGTPIIMDTDIIAENLIKTLTNVTANELLFNHRRSSGD